MKKSIFLFAFLFLSFSTSLLADDDIVWLIKKEVYGAGVLLNNEKYIWLPSTEHYVIRDAVTGEEFKRFKTQSSITKTIYTFNNTMNYLQLNENNDKFYIYETENFNIIDSLTKPDQTQFGYCGFSKTDEYLYEFSSDFLEVWDVKSKASIRKIKFQKEFEEFRTNYSIIGNVACDNQNLISSHIKEFQPTTNPNTWYNTPQVTLNNLLTFDSIGSFENPTSYYRLSNTCKYVAFGKGVEGIGIFDFKTKQLLHTISFQGKPGLGFVFTKDDKYLITTSDLNKYTLQVWDIESNKLIKTYTIPGKILSITNDNKFAYCGNGNDFFKLKLNLDPNSIEDTLIEDTKSYPNPTNDKVNFEFKIDRPDNYNLKVIDLSGKELLTKYIGNLNIGLNKVELEKNNLSKGRYSVLIYSSSNSFKYNIIIGE